MAGLTKEQKKNSSLRISQLLEDLREQGCSFIPGGSPASKIKVLEQQLERRSDDSFVECKLCGYKNDAIFQHLTNNHKISKEDYIKQFPGAVLVSTREKLRLSDKVKGSKNPWAGHGGKLSVFSKNNPNFSEDKKAIAKLRIKETKATTNNDNTKLSYYTSRGYTEHEAKLMRSERQSTFSLDKCIMKYGEEEGLRVFQARQTKWLSTLSNKPEAEKLRIQKAKFNGHRSSVSKLEKSVFAALCEAGLNAEAQFVINGDDRFYIYDIVVGNHIIEVNGDYWHGNPLLYSPGDRIKFPGRCEVVVDEIWKRDALKLSRAQLQGYTTHVIWERDIKKDFDNTIKNLIEKLQ